jgi:D-amino-acid dehydrogenase
VSTSTPSVVIVGAGIVGLASAAYLQRDGRNVLLLDPGGPGEGATSGNAGCLNASSVVPVSMPGTIKQVPGWLMDPLGPLAIRWSYLPSLAPWLWRFWRAGTPEGVQAQARALRPLLVDSIANYRPLAKEAGVEHLIHRIGHLFVYSTEAGFHKDEAAMKLRADNGSDVTVLSREELRELEPDLGPQFTAARIIRENGHCSNPLGLAQGLARLIESRGGKVLRERVTGFETNGGEVVAVTTEQGRHASSHVVLAAGAWSKPLARQLGDNVPLDTERGYHIVIKDAESGPRIPTMWAEGKTVATPMEAGLRFAGTVEFAGIDAPPNWERAYMQLRAGQQMYPALAREYREERLTKWLGFRPSMPDSLPVLGPATRYRNAIHAFGHGHVGLAAGSTTGRVVADLIAARTPLIPIEAFSAKRFA